MNLPLPPVSTNTLKSNISYGELQSYSFEDVSKWVDTLRDELLKLWDEDGLPPHLGTDEETIIKRFQKLNDYPIDGLYIKDELYPNYLGFIKNFTKMGTGVNQFFPALLKSRVNGVSIHDYLSNENLWQDFKYTIVQKVRFDKMFLYSSYLTNDNGVSDLDCFSDWNENIDENIGFWLEPSGWNRLNGKFNRIQIDTKSVKNLLKKGVLGVPELNNEVGYDNKGEIDGYVVRYYDKSQKIFPKLIQILRLGLNQVATNFPVLTARWIYEKYLDEIKDQDQFKVFDSSSGWGSRLLGSLCSHKQINYIGTDVNTENRGCYERLGEFYNSNCGGKNTYEIFYDGSEVIDKNKKFQRHQEQIDLVFTSPPYFNKEEYSTDPGQSYLKFPTYQKWLDGFLDKTFQTYYKYLKPNRYCIINIADIKVGQKNFYPLEQDTISTAVKNGFSYQGKLGMCMTRSIGLDPTDGKNYWFDMKSKSTFKVEPILIFHKG
jgi:hypothetical protein